MLKLMGLILGAGTVFAAILVLVQPRLIETVPATAMQASHVEESGKTVPVSIEPTNSKPVASTTATTMPAAMPKPAAKPPLEIAPPKPEPVLAQLPPLATLAPPAKVVIRDSTPTQSAARPDVADATRTPNLSPANALASTASLPARLADITALDFTPAETDAAPDDNDAITALEADTEWYALWDPFHSKSSADAFAARLERLTGLDYKVVRLAAARYQVAVAAASDEERVANLSQIEQATGLRLVSSP